MDDQFLQKGELPDSLYRRLVNENTEVTAESLARSNRPVPLAPWAAKILAGDASDTATSLSPGRKLFEEHREAQQFPELAALRARVTTFAKRAPDDLQPQMPNAVRVERNVFGNFEEFDSAGNLILARVAGVQLPAEFRQ